MKVQIVYFSSDDEEYHYFSEIFEWPFPFRPLIGDEITLQAKAIVWKDTTSNENTFWSWAGKIIGVEWHHDHNMNGYMVIENSHKPA